MEKVDGRQPHDAREIDRSAMGARNTGESRYERRRKVYRHAISGEILINPPVEYIDVLQQHWQWDDGTDAGWRDVPVVDGD